ncbi:MAG: sulfatase-like hydrolase/transferase [Verrucomicrobiota bacterium]
MKFLCSLLALCLPVLANDKPNILMIVSEDNSSHWIGCYGNKQAQTPRIDALAKEGFLFEHAYSNAPVCAVARSTILLGAYAPTVGTQHMRSRHPIPQTYRPNVEYLRAAGYYCTNHAKTDYNFKGNDNSYWDQSSDKAHYKNRPEGKPFFAVFNIYDSHESSLFDNHPAEPERLKPVDVELPPYLPDLPEIRKDIARYHDRITAMDTNVGKMIDELEKAGLADNTIIIYVSDHGGILPRGKRYLQETGVKVPLVVRIPEKFQKLSPFKTGDRVAEPVSFVDFSATLLSLAGIDTPAQMQGRPFLGEKRKEPATDEMEFLYADRFDELYGMRRGLTDGKWKYTRNFQPHLPNAPYSFYQFGQPGWVAYEKAWKEDELCGYHKALWEAPSGSEQLYDLTTDPWEMKNLATDPAHSGKLAVLRERLKTTMKQAHDTGLVPEPMFESLGGEATIANYVQSDAFDINKITDLAFAATEMNEKHLPLFREAVKSKHPVERYWATTGLMLLNRKSPVLRIDELPGLLKDEQPVIRTIAAEAFWNMGQKELAVKSLVTDVESQIHPTALLHLLNTLRRLELLQELPKGWEKGKSMKDADFDYIQRFTDQIKK